MNKQTLGVTLVILLGVQLVLVAYFAGWFESKPDTSATAEDKEDSWKLPPAAERHKELPGFFEQLAAARESGHAELVNGHCDTERWADEVVAAVKRDKGVMPANFRQRLLGELVGKSLTQSLLPPWKGVRIDWQQFRELPVPGEVQVFVSHRVGDGSDYHMCWWLKYGRTGWRYFDWEDRELEERFSTSASQIAKLRADDVAKWGPAGVQLWRAEDLVQRGLGKNAAFQRDRLEAAATTLHNIRNYKFPAVVEAHRWLLSGIVALRQKEPAKALKDFDKAEDFRKPIPYTDRLRAQAYLDLGDSGRALAAVNRYTGPLGDDSLTFRIRGTALGRLGLLPAALQSFRASLQDAPGGKD